MGSRVIHFEIHADNPQRAIEFYTAVFGWEVKKWEGPMEYWLITTGPEGDPGINGGLMLRMGPPPVNGQAVNAFVCTAETDSVDHSVSIALANGGQLAVAKMPVPGVGWLAYVKDTEGNIFGLMQRDTKAE